jgi:hypothetical protein
MFSSEVRFDRKIEVLENGWWHVIQPADLKEGDIIRMWGLFIDKEGNSTFKIDSAVYNKDGHKNIDVKPINLEKEIEKNGEQSET